MTCAWIAAGSAGAQTIETLAGTGTAGFSGDGGPATEARFFKPYGLAIAPNGDVYISGFGNFRVRRIGHGTGIVTTFARRGERIPPRARLSGYRRISRSIRSAIC